MSSANNPDPRLRAALRALLSNPETASAVLEGILLAEEGSAFKELGLLLVDSSRQLTDAIRESEMLGPILRQEEIRGQHPARAGVKSLPADLFSTWDRVLQLEDAIILATASLRKDDGWVEDMKSCVCEDCGYVGFSGDGTCPVKRPEDAPLLQSLESALRGKRRS